MKLCKRAGPGRKSERHARQNPRKTRIFCSALGRTRTCELLVRSLNQSVLTGPSLSADLAYSNPESGLALHGYSVPFGSVLILLLLLLPHCCHMPPTAVCAVVDLLLFTPSVPYHTQRL